jgi:hypothetical protein
MIKQKEIPTAGQVCARMSGVEVSVAARGPAYHIEESVGEVTACKEGKEVH